MSVEEVTRRVSVAIEEAASVSEKDHLKAIETQISAWKQVIDVQEEALRKSESAMKEKTSIISDMERQLLIYKEQVEALQRQLKNEKDATTPTIATNPSPFEAAVPRNVRSAQRRASLGQVLLKPRATSNEDRTGMLERIMSMPNPEHGERHPYDIVLCFPNPDHSSAPNKGIDKKHAQTLFETCFKGEETYDERGIGEQDKNAAAQLEVMLKAFDQLQPHNNHHQDKKFARGGQLESNEAALKAQAKASKTPFHAASVEWYDTGKPAQDFASLMRNLVVSKLNMHCGLTTKTMMSVDGSTIYVAVAADEEDLRIEAERSRFNLQFDVECTDILSLEPCDRLFRTLRSLVEKNDKGQSRWDGMTAAEKRASGVTAEQLQLFDKYVKMVGNPLKNAEKDTLGNLTLSASEGVKQANSILEAIEEINKGLPPKRQLQNLWSRLGLKRPVGAYCDYSAETLNGSTNKFWRRYHKGSDSIFRTMDRMKLIKSIISRQIDLDALILHKCLDSLLCLSEEKERQALQSIWLLSVPSWNQPVDRIRGYFGEKIALYFSFLGFYTSWLSTIGIIGLITFIIQRTTVDDSDVQKAFNGIICIMVAIWATLFLEYWKRRQVTHAVTWGQTDFEEDEVARPQFKGVPRRSPINDDENEMYFSGITRIKRMLCGSNLSLLVLACAIAAIAGIFILRSYLTKHSILRTSNVDFGPVVTGIINAIQIQTFNTIYTKLAFVLTNWENHRTQTQYEDALILKTFCFQFINSYNTFFYIAFLKTWVEGCVLFNSDGKRILNSSGDPILEIGANCMPELNTQLTTIFLVAIVKNFAELGVPYLKKIMNSRKRRAAESLKTQDIELASLVGMSIEEKKLRDSIDEQAGFESYIMMGVDGTFGDYAELVIQFGFVTLFCVAFPLAPIIACVTNLLEIKVDSTKLLNLTRRPLPNGAEDIGSWYAILEIMSVFAILTNTALLVFVTKIFSPLPSNFDSKFTPFFIITVGLLILKQILKLIVPDVPGQYNTVLKRHAYIVDNLMKKAPIPSDVKRADAERVNLSVLGTQRKGLPAPAPAAAASGVGALPNRA